MGQPALVSQAGQALAQDWRVVDTAAEVDRLPGGLEHLGQLEAEKTTETVA